MDKRFQLIKPFIGDKIYDASSFNKGAKKCFREIVDSKIDGIKEFSVKDVDSGEIFKFAINKRQSGGSGTIGSTLQDNTSRNNLHVDPTIEPTDNVGNEVEQEQPEQPIQQQIQKPQPQQIKRDGSGVTIEIEPTVANTFRQSDVTHNVNINNERIADLAILVNKANDKIDNIEKTMIARITELHKEIQADTKKCENSGDMCVLL